MRLKLSEDDKSVIEKYMEEKDIAAEEKMFLAYIAGGMDMYMFLKERNYLRVDSPWEDMD
ncbi:MAG: hypothetical protein LUE86_07925 [Clostridiales bacterium]|nr:hypothetical protein [Clostridiales bacterium]